MRQIIAIDPTETAEIDLLAAAVDRSIRLWESVAKKAREESNAEARARAEEALTAARAERERYAGDGPRFTLGCIPGEKKALISGMLQDAEEATGRGARAEAEHRWRREVIRWAVRGHRGLRRADGSEVSFLSEPARVAGEGMQVPTERQIEVYVSAGIFADLAALALEAQRLPDAEKNG